MVETVAQQVLGYVGGLLLAISLWPQIVKVYQTKSARDFSWVWLAIFLAGLVLTMIYLILIQAKAGYIMIAFEVAATIWLMALKAFYDAFHATSPAEECMTMQADAKGNEEDVEKRGK